MCFNNGMNLKRSVPTLPSTIELRCKRQRVSLCSPSLQQQQSQPLPQRKKVHFSVSPNDIIEYIPPSAELSGEERNVTWISKSELVDFQRVASHDAINIQKYQHVLYQVSSQTFSQAYTNLYTLYHERDDKSLTKHDNEAIMELSLLSDHTRGIEDRIVLNLGIDRRLKRKKLIQAICSASRLLNNARKEQQRTNMTTIQQPYYQEDDENALLLHHISQSLSQPARQFAELYGMIDTASAMMEYAATC